jgi:ribosome-binding factor A
MVLILSILLIILINAIVPYRYVRKPRTIREALAESLETRAEFQPGVLVTLVRAELTGDSKHAKGTLSVLPEDRVDEVLETLKLQNKYIKESLNKKLRLRRVPELSWAIDRTEESAAEVEKILNELEEKGEL